MVTHIKTILQLTLQDCFNMCDHFTTLCMKGLKGVEQICDVLQISKFQKMFMYYIYLVETIENLILRISAFG